MHGSVVRHRSQTRILLKYCSPLTWCRSATSTDPPQRGTACLGLRVTRWFRLRTVAPSAVLFPLFLSYYTLVFRVIQVFLVVPFLTPSLYLGFFGIHFFSWIFSAISLGTMSKKLKATNNFLFDSLVSLNFKSRYVWGRPSYAVGLWMITSVSSRHPQYR